MMRQSQSSTSNGNNRNQSIRNGAENPYDAPSLRPPTLRVPNVGTNRYAAPSFCAPTSQVPFGSGNTSSVLRSEVVINNANNNNTVSNTSAESSTSFSSSVLNSFQYLVTMLSPSAPSVVPENQRTNDLRIDGLKEHPQFEELLKIGIQVGLGKVLTTSLQFKQYVDKWRDPISQEIFEKPVILPNGTIVELKSYEDHMRGKENSLTREFIPQSYNPPRCLTTQNQIAEFILYVEKSLKTLCEDKAKQESERKLQVN